LPDRLLTELTAHRTLGLRHALGEHPEIAFLAALHGLALQVFYTYAAESCLELTLKSVQFGSQAPGLNDTAMAKAVNTRHQAWREALPKDSTELWDALQSFDSDSRQALFAHCVAQGVNAVHEAWNRRPRAFAHGDRLAQAVDLDMVAEGWTPTIDGYFGRVTKARILQAVSEAKGQRAADRIEHLKKDEMAEQAAALLLGSGWLAEPLRTPKAPGSADASTISENANHNGIGEETATDGGETAVVQLHPTNDSEATAIEPHAVAAE
jgi:ParB family chromosome partitioning protein